MIKDLAETPIRIGIDATNIRIGGGITHLLEFLESLDAQALQVEAVSLWAGEQTLQRLPNRPWLKKINPLSLNRSLFHRVFWQIFCLSKAAKEEKCDVLFVPGGSYVGSFQPAVTMSQNLFPFEWSMILKVGISLRFFKFIFLRWSQTMSFRRSEGIIFLTQYAKNAVIKVTGSLKGRVAVIPHGLNSRFTFQEKPQLSIEHYSHEHPYRLIYVSTVDVYKNQEQIIIAVDLLRKKGFPLSLTLVGPSEPRALKTLFEFQKMYDSEGLWLDYLGALPYKTLNLEYQKADLGVFASSCETFGMTVLEKMSIGLPIACSELSCMHEILGDGGIYFDPYRPESIAAVIESYICSPQLREEKIKIACKMAEQYSWIQCADQTVKFLRSVAKLSPHT
jgi:glycosyltransferase involved in cell wall biosynthesis